MRRAQLKAIRPQDDGEQSDEEEKEEEMKEQQPGSVSAGRGKTSCKPGNLVKCDDKWHVRRERGENKWELCNDHVSLAAVLPRRTATKAKPNCSDVCGAAAAAAAGAMLRIL